jgi:hypothetical protein
VERICILFSFERFEAALPGLIDVIDYPGFFSLSLRCAPPALSNRHLRFPPSSARRRGWLAALLITRTGYGLNIVDFLYRVQELPPNVTYVDHYGSKLNELQGSGKLTRY